MNDQHAKSPQQDSSQDLTPQQRQFQQRRRLLKAAAMAAPVMLTLHAKSVYAQSQELASTGIGYGYGNGDDQTAARIQGRDLASSRSQSASRRWA